MTCCQWATVRFCHLCLQAETVVVGSQQRLPYGSMGMVIMGQKKRLLMVLQSALFPHKFVIHAVKPRALTKWSCWTNLDQNTVLMRCGLPMTSRGLAGHQSCSDSMPLVDLVDGSTNQTYVTSNSTLPYALMGKCKHFMPNTCKSWTAHY